MYRSTEKLTHTLTDSCGEEKDVRSEMVIGSAVSLTAFII